MKPFRGLLAGLLLATVSLSAQAQTQVAKGDSVGTTQANRLQLGADNTRMGQKGSTGNFRGFAFKDEVMAAQGSAVQTVNNKTPTAGNINISATDVGLGNVSNTSDANKPISTLQQQAFDAKANLATSVYSDAVASYSALSSYTVPNGKAYLITVRSDERYKKKDGSNSINTLYWKSVSSDGSTTTLYKVTFIDESN